MKDLLKASWAVIFLGVLLTVTIWLVLFRVPKVPTTQDPCRDELVQVKRGVTGMSESTLEFKCSHPRQQLVQAMSPYGGVPVDGVYICRCIDLHAVATKQETQLSILFERLDWMEKNGWAPPASSTQMQSVQQRLQSLEQRDPKP